MRSSHETSLLVALLFKRSNQKRGRISTDTIRRLSQRKHLRSSFIEILKSQLDSLGLILVELERGGYGLIPWSALDGAPAITAKKFLNEDLAKLKKGELDFDDIQDELDGEADIDDDYE